MSNITLMTSNPNILLTIDEGGRWNNLYYPNIGLWQNLLESRVGIYHVDSGAFEWICKNRNWDIRQKSLGNSNTCVTECSKGDLTVNIIDRVHPNHDIIIRKFVLTSQSHVRLRIFHYQAFNMKQSSFQETCYWDETRPSIVHYKQGIYFNISGFPEFTNHACGEHTLKGLKGTHMDAEDGELQGGGISHGSVDSAVQWDIEIWPEKECQLYMLVLCGRSREEINTEYDYVVGRDTQTPHESPMGHLYNLEMESDRFWISWAAGRTPKLPDEFSERVAEIYRRSLFVIANCADGRGSVIASPDIGTLNLVGDTYGYCWWRDGGYIAMAMSAAGMQEMARSFIKFANDCQSPEGYFLHRHLPDGSLGSTWHPPPFLQIDQTATVISAAWRNYLETGNTVFLLRHWQMIKSAARFLSRFTDQETGLPKPSFDLWEEKKAVNAYSVAAVIKGLRDAERIANELGKDRSEWAITAEKMNESLLSNFYNEDKKSFRKAIDPLDDSLDSSLLMLINLDVLTPDDPRSKELVESVEKRLWAARTGGLARYEGDSYHGHENPWIICTLWLAQAYIKFGKKDKALKLIEWAASTATETNLLPEQIDSGDGEAVSVMPLVWSHATFILTVKDYLDKFYVSKLSTEVLLSRVE